MKRHLYIFLHGLVVVVPIVVTGWIIYKCASWIDSPMQELLSNVFHKTIPGLGLIAAIILIYLVGLIVRFLFIRRMLRLFNRFVEKLPMIKSIYSAVIDLVKFFGGSGKQQKRKVVRVPLAGGKGHMLGIVMQNSKAGAQSEPVPVYLPMSYGLGGFLVFVAPENVEAVDMDAETALKLVMTAGAAGAHEAEPKTAPTQPPKP